MKDVQLAEAWEQYRENEDSAAKKRLMEHYVPLVETIAAKMHKKLPNSVEYGDLVNDGFFGLVEAIERFDASRGFKFETYAGSRIRGEMSDKLREYDWVSRYYRLKFKSLYQTRDFLREELQREPSEQEVADRLGWTVKEVDRIQAQFGDSYTNSIAERMKDSTHEIFPMEDLLADSSIGDPGFNLDLVDISSQLVVALGSLRDQESKVVYLYHYEELSFTKIAQILDVNASRVSQIYDQAVTGLKEKLIGG